MAESTAGFARGVAAAWSERDGFEGTETIRAGDVEVTGRVRWRSPDRVAVEYRTYQHPLLTLEEELVGGAEYTPDELAEMALRYDGRDTWISEPGRRVVVQRPGRRLFEPLIGLDAIGELSFLRDLTRDFLIRDAGTAEEGGRTVRRLDLKPRALHRSHLVKNVRFAVQRARVSFDVATRFPARMEMTLDPGAFAVPLIPPSAEVRIEYSDVRLAAPPASAFGAPSGTDARLFAERDTRAGGDGDGLPFELPLGPMFERGYRLNGGRPIAIVDEPGERAYCTCIAHRGDGADGAAVTLRVGNYLSRNMNRRRAWIAENGEPISIGDLRGRRIDRNERWPEGIPRSERPLIELAWEREGIHAFLLGDGVAETDLIEIAQDWAPRIRPRRGSGDQRDAPSE